MRISITTAPSNTEIINIAKGDKLAIKLVVLDDIPDTKFAGSSII